MAYIKKLEFQFPISHLCGENGKSGNSNRINFSECMAKTLEIVIVNET